MVGDDIVVVSGGENVAVLDDSVVVFSSRGDDFSVLVDGIVVVSGEEDDLVLLVAFFVGDEVFLPRGYIVVTSVMYDVVVLADVFETPFVGDLVPIIAHFVDFKVDSDCPRDTGCFGENSPDGLVIAFVSEVDEVFAARNQRKQNIQ